MIVIGSYSIKIITKSIYKDPIINAGQNYIIKQSRVMIDTINIISIING
jgi:hypothetical protein